MKLNEIDFNKLDDNDLKQLGLKFKIINEIEANQLPRNELLFKIKSFIILKIKKKQENLSRRRNSAPNVLNPPTSKMGLQRTMSHPITTVEKVEAATAHNVNEIKNNNQTEIKNELKSLDPKYDMMGMYPAVKRLVAIGDLHGDLIATVKVLKLAEVIRQDADPNNIDGIKWCGGDTWVVQLGDQIDRCRPDEWKQNCIVDFDDVVEDEGNNMAIFKLFLRLDVEARKEGGAVIGLLGNHELMNVDKDFRYVSPQEFLEFVPQNERNNKYTDDGYPMGYYHRTKAFERGGNISKIYATKKKSIVTIGSYLFVHGGLSHQLCNKYNIADINNVVSKWLLKEDNDTESKIFNEVFRDDDDMSPFWCRIFAEDDGEGENTEENFNKLLEIVNQRNNLLNPIKGMVIAHTPQFMDGKYLNSTYNDKLWRIDVGMSRAFGSLDNMGENKLREPQLLIIHNDNQFEKRRMPHNCDRYPSSNMGGKVDINNQNLPF